MSNNYERGNHPIQVRGKGEDASFCPGRLFLGIALLILLGLGIAPAMAGEQGKPPQAAEPNKKTEASGEIAPQTGPAGQQQSILNSVSIELEDLETAGQTFIALYNYLLPVSGAKDASDVCHALAMAKYIGPCETVLNNRIEWLKNSRGLTGAQFPEGTITANKDLQNAVDIEWKEVLFFGEKSQANKYHLRLFYAKEDKNWKVSKIEEFF